jgi:hypothetical protein
MKRKFPEWIMRLLPIALLTTLINMFLFYIVGYWISNDGVTTKEMYLFLIAPTMLFLVVTMIVNYFALKQYRLECFFQNKKPYAGWLILSILSISIFLFGLAVDWLYFLIDPYLSTEFGLAFEALLLQAGESESVVKTISDLPLYSQNYVGISVGIFVGTIISVIAANTRVKKPQVNLAS